MAPMNTYSLVRPHPGGLSITDAIVIQGNRRRPVRLEKAGDSIDLMAVDVPTFARSSYVGMIRHLFLSGVLAAIPQEVSNERAAQLNEAYSRLNENGGNFIGIAGAPTVVQIEPGMQVGVMGQPEAAPGLPDIPTPSGMSQRSVEIAPGVVAPGVDPGSGVRPAQAPQFEGARTVAAQLEGGLMAPPGQQVPQAPPESEAPKKGTKKKAKKDPASAPAAPAGEAPKAGTSYAEWKSNLDFATQKTRVAESVDLEFLRWVAENDDSRQLQKIAAARLAELSRVSGS